LFLNLDLFTCFLKNYGFKKGLIGKEKKAEVIKKRGKTKLGFKRGGAAAPGRPTTAPVF